MKDLTIVIFACEKREHLLFETLKKIKKLQKNSIKTILSFDGNLGISDFRTINADEILIHKQRKGYINSICEVLSLINTRNFLWVEEDWEVEKIKNKDIKNALKFLRKESKFFQVRWPKDKSSDKQTKAWKNILYSDVKFSANPNIIKTKVAKEAFKKVKEFIGKKCKNKKGIGFEEFVSHWVENNGLKAGVFSSKSTGTLHHFGYLESTERKWHYVDFDEKKKCQMREGIININLWTLIPRFVIKTIKVCICSFFNQRSAEIAFRFNQIE